MSFEEIYPVVRTQATFNVMRYDTRRSDKISELVAQSYEKYLSEKKSGKEIQLNNYKHFVTQRAKELDIRSVCKKGLGGTSKIDALGYFQRRSDGKAGVVQFHDYMSFNLTCGKIIISYCKQRIYEGTFGRSGTTSSYYKMA